MEATGGSRHLRRRDLGIVRFTVLGLRAKGTLEEAGTEKCRYHRYGFGHNMIEEPIRCPSGAA